MQAWAKKPAQRILKVHGDSQQVAACLTKLSNFDRCSNLSNIDEEVRKIAVHQITASDLNTFTNTLLINIRRKFVTTTKSDDELISLKETFGLCEGNVRTWLVNSALESVESRMNCADNNHVTGLWDIRLLDASWYRVDSRLVTIDGLGMLLVFYQVSAFGSLVCR